MIKFDWKGSIHAKIRGKQAPENGTVRKQAGRRHLGAMMRSLQRRGLGKDKNDSASAERKKDSNQARLVIAILETLRGRSLWGRGWQDFHEWIEKIPGSLDDKNDLPEVPARSDAGCPVEVLTGGSRQWHMSQEGQGLTSYPRCQTKPLLSNILNYSLEGQSITNSTS